MTTIPHNALDLHLQEIAQARAEYEAISAAHRTSLYDEELFRLAYTYGQPCLISRQPGVIHRVNNTAVTTLGWSADEISAAKELLKARGWRWLTHPEDQARVRTLSIDAYAQAQAECVGVFETDTRYRRKDNSWLPVRLTVRVICSSRHQDLIKLAFFRPLRREG